MSFDFFVFCLLLVLFWGRASGMEINGVLCPHITQIFFPKRKLQGLFLQEAGSYLPQLTWRLGSCSLAVTSIMTKSNEAGKAFISAYILWSRQEVMAGSQGMKLEAGTMEECCSLTNTVLSHLPKNDTTHPRLGPPASISNPSNPPQICPCRPDRSRQVLNPDDSRLCQVDDLD